MGDRHWLSKCLQVVGIHYDVVTVTLYPLFTSGYETNCQVIFFVLFSRKSFLDDDQWLGKCLHAE